LARAIADGLAEAGNRPDFIYADDILGAFLRDCRACRKPDGCCAISDGFRSVFLEKFLPAQGFVAATPIYWYGMSSQLKAFFDRMFCYVAASYPDSPSVVASMTGKRIGLALSSEETFPTVSAGIVHQVQEYARYTRSTFVGHVHGYGNSRGEVCRYPAGPVARARQFGRDFFTAHATDYQIDTPRSGRVWGALEDSGAGDLHEEFKKPGAD
jgi:multimeric flavodoxin WrbA